METYRVFEPNVVNELARKHQHTFKALGEIEELLNGRFSDMKEPIHALILAVASGEPLLFVGPPGTAKSRLIRVFCDLAGLIDLNKLQNGANSEESSDYFEYLLTPFTEPGELFGYYEIIEGERSRHLERKEEGMMQKAKVVYLDEVFNGSSAILNSILAFVNERVFHDRGQRKKVALQVLFGATNDVPQTRELRAIYDRFLLRCEVNNAQEEKQQIKALLEKGWRETYSIHTRKPHRGLLDDLEKFRDDLKQETSQGRLKVTMDDKFLGYLTQRVSHIRRMDLSDMSNRRLIKMLNVMLIHAMYMAVSTNHLNQGITFSDEQLNLLRFAQDRRDELVEESLKYRDAELS